MNPDSREPKPSVQKPPIPANPLQAPTDLGPQPAPSVVLDHHGLKPVTPPANRRKKLIWMIAVPVTALLCLLIAAGGVWVWYNAQLAPVDKSSNQKIKVVIVPGTDPKGIARQLKQDGLIRNEQAFLWYVRLQDVSGSLQSGGYRLAKADDVPTIVKHLTSGKTDTFSITFLPGNTMAKHRQTLLDAGYEASAVDAALNKRYDGALFAGRPTGADLEGYIYGETYNFPTDATPEQILQRTFDQFQMVIEKNDLIRKYRARGFSLYEGITLASIIQREERELQNQRQVAQVFLRRMKIGMPLGSDPTYQYAADKQGMARDPGIESPYNTRIVKGLPPGPISSPGETALIAVASPAEGEYLYFLSGDDDRMYFGRTLEEHERNIREHCLKKCQIL